MTNSKAFVINMTKPIGSTVENERTYKFYAEQLKKTVREMGLTIAGEDFPPVTSGYDLADFGNLLTIGTARNHDVNWVRRPTYACEKGYKPVLNLIEDWNLIQKKLAEYYADKYELRLRSGAKVSFHDGFVKIGTEIITYDELFKVVDKYVVIF